MSILNPSLSRSLDSCSSSLISQNRPTILNKHSKYVNPFVIHCFLNRTKSKVSHPKIQPFRVGHLVCVAGDGPLTVLCSLPCMPYVPRLQRENVSIASRSLYIPRPLSLPAKPPPLFLDDFLLVVVVGLTVQGAAHVGDGAAAADRRRASRRAPPVRRHLKVVACHY
jgi:hypothetical protein